MCLMKARLARNVAKKLSVVGELMIGVDDGYIT